MTNTVDRRSLSGVRHQILQRKRQYFQEGASALARLSPPHKSDRVGSRLELMEWKSGIPGRDLPTRLFSLTRKNDPVNRDKEAEYEE